MCVCWQATYLQETRTQTVAPVPTPEAGAQLLPGIEAYLTQHDVYQKLDALVKELVARQPEDPIDFLVQRFKVACPAAAEAASPRVEPHAHQPCRQRARNT